MAMSTIDDGQVLAPIRPLPSERKAWLLRVLVSEGWPCWAELAEDDGQRCPVHRPSLFSWKVQ